MPRIERVAKCRKSPGTCDKCQTVIPIGAPWKSFAFFRGAAHVRCGTCPDWKASEMCGSATASALLAAQENADEAIDAWDGEDADGLKGILADAAEEFRGAASGFEEAAENIEQGFQHETSQSAEFKEKAEEINSFADELENRDIDEFEEEEFDEDEERKGVENEASDQHDEAAREQWIKEKLEARREEHRREQETAKDEWIEAQRAEAQSALSNCPS